MPYTKFEGGHPLVLEGDEEHGFATPPSQKRKPISNLCLTILVIALLASGFTLGLYLGGEHSTIPFVLRKASASSSTSCKKQVIRREWRSLSTEQKHDYLNAVQCLKERPSRLGEAQSLYDDFPWIHYRIGDYSHHAAAFLAWHRSFIHTYERALREDCGYQGHLTYWDWTLDWEDMSKAPVWSSTGGFGGNGDHDVGESIVGGHCVTSGPFANLQILYIDNEYHPHCLSRGFYRGKKLRELGEWFRPSVIDELMEEDNYENFLLKLEDGPHIAIPRSIRGDFAMLTAPSDPVFFLHHTQLDRLWWIWQQRDVEGRQWQYHGAAEHNSTERATLHDLLPLGGLGDNFLARQVLSTESEVLCYRY